MQKGEGSVVNSFCVVSGFCVFSNEFDVKVDASFYDEFVKFNI